MEAEINTDGTIHHHTVTEPYKRNSETNLHIKHTEHFVDQEITKQEKLNDL